MINLVIKLLTSKAFWDFAERITLAVLEELVADEKTELTPADKEKVESAIKQSDKTKEVK